MPVRLFLAFLLNMAWSLAAAQGGVLHRSYPPLEGRVAHEHALLHHTNLERERAGLAPLATDEALTLAARQHAAEMVRLTYMSHESPLPENATPIHRVARAGSAARTVAENLARVGDDAQAPATAVRGWMGSPGHRANLLDPRFTHTGFGVASTGRGQIHVVQLLAQQPLRTVASDVRRVTRERSVARVSVDVRSEGEFSLGYGGERVAPRTLRPGRHVLTFPLESGAPVHVRIGARAPAGGAFIGQDGGWFDADRFLWTPSESFPQRDARIVDVQAARERTEIVRVALAFERPPTRPLGVWLDDAFWSDFDLRGRDLTIELPAAESGSVLALGLRRPGEERRYLIVQTMRIEAVDGELRLVPHVGR